MLLVGLVALSITRIQPNSSWSRHQCERSIESVCCSPVHMPYAFIQDYSIVVNNLIAFVNPKKEKTKQLQYGLFSNRQRFIQAIFSQQSESVYPLQTQQLDQSHQP